MSTQKIWIEIAAWRYTLQGIEGLVQDNAQANGVGVYIRSPLAFHLLDFDIVGVAGRYDNNRTFATFEGAHAAAMKFADALAEHLATTVDDCTKAAEVKPATVDDAEYGVDILMEAGACLWEAALDAIAAGNVRALAAKEEIGMSALRSVVIGLANECETAWRSLDVDQQEDVGAFDWEFCPPWLLHRMGWTDKDPIPAWRGEKPAEPAAPRWSDIVTAMRSCIDALTPPKSDEEIDAIDKAKAAIDQIAMTPATGIVSTARGYHERKGPGARVTMSDGSVWFHPFDGGTPIKEA